MVENRAAGPAMPDGGGTQPSPARQPVAVEAGGAPSFFPASLACIGRLTAPDDFARVLRAQRLGATPHFELFAAGGPGGPGAQPRLGLAISKKSAPTAVLRNLAKRLAREAARAAGQRGLPAQDYVLRARRLLGPDWRAAKEARTSGVFRRTLRGELDRLFARPAATQGAKSE